MAYAGSQEFGKILEDKPRVLALASSVMNKCNKVSDERHGC